MGLSFLLAAPSLHAASSVWDGGASTTSLNTAANWNPDGTTFGQGDVLIWNGLQAGNLSLQWTASIGPGGGAAQGLNISVTGANIDALSLDATTGSFGLGNITIASGAGAFTMGDGAGTANLVLRNPAASTFFTNESSSTATLRSDVVLQNGGGIGGRVLTFAGAGNWLVEGALISSAFSSSSTAGLVKDGSGRLTLTGASIHGGGFNGTTPMGTTLNGGVLEVTHGSALGAGIVRVNGSFGTRLELSNNIALVGPTNISLTGRNNTPDSTSSGASIRNLSGNNSIAANIVFANTGGTNVNLLSTAGTLTLNGTLSTSLTTAVRTFSFAGDGDFIVNGAVSNGSSTVGVIKNGTGTLRLAGANSYTGPTTITQGRLALGANNIFGATNFELAGGELAVGGFTNTAVGTLDLNGDGITSFITFAEDGSFAFANSSALDWGTNTLSLGGSFDNGSSLRFGLDASGLSGGQLSLITVNGFGAGIDSFGYLYAIPEPSTYAGIVGLAALGLAILRRRRKA